MSRVHCLDCGMSVVVDPAGICPEGHLVGSAGARVASAIGSSVPHPDEPEPWVAKVEVDQAPTSEPATRPIRPVSVPGAATEPNEAAAVDSDELLRELHSLADFGDLAPHGPMSGRPGASMLPPAAPTPRPATPTPPPAAAPPPVVPEPSPPARQPADAPVPSSVDPDVSRRTEDAGALAELSALEAAVQALGIDDLAGGNGNGSAHPPKAAKPDADTREPEPFHSIDLITDGSARQSQDADRDAVAPIQRRERSIADEFTAEGASQFAELESLFSAPSAPSPVMPPTSEPTQIPASTEAPAGTTAPRSAAPTAPPPAASSPPAQMPDEDRWSVLADVAALADSAPASLPSEAADPDEAPSAADTAAERPPNDIDIGNFTARGRRVGRREAAKRQRRRRR